ncbi:hypothetical protein TNCV_716981 [Trichonephila clavipes]|nr:hypothetical protein TNCV_716981 [Trichonephila clavipes]
MDSWQACHEFEPSTAEDTPCRLKRPSVGVVRNSDRSTGRGGMNNLSLTYPHWKTNCIKSQDFRIAIGLVACCSPRLFQFMGEEDVHQGNLTRWPTSVMVHHPIGE